MIFDLAYQVAQPLDMPYESPKGFTHHNEVQYCPSCQRDTVQAICNHSDDYTNRAKTVRIITQSIYRDCLCCMNTTYEKVSEEKISLGKSS